VDAASRPNLSCSCTPEQVNPLVRQRVHDMQYHAFTIPTPSSIEEIALQPPAITRLAEIRVPTLIIVGDHDLPEKLEQTAELAAHIPGAQRVVIPGAAHMVSMEQPEQFNHTVLDFLRKVMSS
jgi:3-oxoadipate enol-lactonase